MSEDTYDVIIVGAGPAGLTAALIMKLNRNIIDPLTQAGYITKTKHGRENSYQTTDTGKYISSLSGLIK